MARQNVFSEEPANSAEKSANLAEKSADSAEKPANLAEKSANSAPYNNIIIKKENNINNGVVVVDDNCGDDFIDRKVTHCCEKCVEFGPQNARIFSARTNELFCAVNGVRLPR